MRSPTALSPLRPGGIRYWLNVDRTHSAPCIAVFAGRRVILKWRDAPARRLLEARPLPSRYLACGVHEVSKKMALCLALVAAAQKLRYEVEHEDRFAPRIDARERLWQRLDELHIRLPALHRRAAELLFRYPGTHLSESDAECLMSLEYPFVDRERLRSAGADLARWGVVQRIAVEGHVFYDIDTRPHLHLFRPATGELVDAPSSGVVSTA